MFRRYSLALLNCLALAGTTFAGVWGTIFSSTMELKALIVSTIALSSLISFAVSVSSSREVAFTRTALSSILEHDRIKLQRNLRDECIWRIRRD